MTRRECPNWNCLSNDSDLVLTRNYNERERNRLAVRCRMCGLTGPHRGDDDSDGENVADAAEMAWNALPRLEGIVGRKRYADDDGRKSRAKFLARYPTDEELKSAAATLNAFEHRGVTDWFALDGAVFGPGVYNVFIAEEAVYVADALEAAYQRSTVTSGRGPVISGRGPVISTEPATGGG